MWNGTPEDIAGLANSLKEFTGNPLVQQYAIQWEKGQSPWYWEGLGRYLGTKQVSERSEYWREPIYQATQLEDSVVMIKTELAKQLPFQPGGRDVYFNSSTNSIRNVGAQNPMIHHYSWVRTKEEMLKKVSNWGHAGDKVNWKELVEEEYSRPFNGQDFLHNYQYTIVDNKFNI